MCEGQCGEERRDSKKQRPRLHGKETRKHWERQFANQYQSPIRKICRFRHQVPKVAQNPARG